MDLVLKTYYGWWAVNGTKPNQIHSYVNSVIWLLNNLIKNNTPNVEQKKSLPVVNRNIDGMSAMILIFSTISCSSISYICAIWISLF